MVGNLQFDNNSHVSFQRSFVSLLYKPAFRASEWSSVFQHVELVHCDGNYEAQKSTPEACSFLRRSQPQVTVHVNKFNWTLQHDSTSWESFISISFCEF